MKQRIVTISILTASVLALSGCGSSGNNTTTPPVAPTTGTAIYVDSAVQGVSVTCGSTTSVTDVNGRFTYEDGKDCQFSVGSIPLRTESGLYQDKIVIEDNIQTAQYLQSMDYDGDPSNGIMMHEQTASVMTQQNLTHVPANDQELAEAVTAMEHADMGYQGRFVHEQEAQEHLNDTKQKYPGAGQPGSGQPNSGQPSSGEPGTGQPDADHPNSGQPGSGEPATGQPNNQNNPNGDHDQQQQGNQQHN